MKFESLEHRMNYQRKLIGEAQREQHRWRREELRLKFELRQLIIENNARKYSEDNYEDTEDAI